ncbi:ABC transporter permease [Negadavirga shengliensis]|uniref:ABC transporter permease n=1 Tax=Negadavirga shengliensis TaxID=1389218 RepID=A0ABV9SWE3_9BACT
MIRNYLLIAYRNVKRYKLRTFVHVLGLSLGIAVCLLVFSLVYFENSFDKFHPDKEKIYQVNTLTSYMDQSWPNNGVPVPLASVIQDEVPEIATKTQFYTLWEVKVQDPEKDRIYQGGDVILADNGFFEIFPRNWLAGDPKQALSGLNQTVLTASSAEKYFSGLSPTEVIGKELTYYFFDTVYTQVTGVVADFSENTDIMFTDFISLQHMSTDSKKKFYQTDNWNSVNSSSQLFVKLYHEAQKKAAEKKLLAIVEKHVPSEDENRNMEFSLLPLKELHFQSNFDRPSASKTVLKGLIIIGVFILVLASINFINLETAQSIVRSKEVGIRKTLGSSRPQLIFQFLAETALIVGLSLLLGIFICEMLGRYFQEFLPKTFDINYLSSSTIGFMVVAGIALTLISGFFPSLILSAFQPQQALKKAFKNPKGFSIGHFIQKNLTVFQFALSIGFIIAVLVVSSQIKYLTEKDLGFDKEHIVYVRLPFSAPQHQAESFKNTIDQQNSVKYSSLGNDMIASMALWTSIVTVEKEDEKTEYEVQVKTIDKDYLDVYHALPLAGNNLREVEHEILINQNFVTDLGFEIPEEAVGKFVNWNDADYIIVGVVPNFHSRHLREKILPMVMVYKPDNAKTLNIRLQEGTDLLETKATLDTLLHSFFPSDELEFQFFDETIANFYKSEYQFRKVLTMATLMALVISLLGLFALTSFTIAQKTKEISIRKILGATVSQILLGISKEYVVLLILSFFLGAVPAWYLLGSWLEDFQFRINMPMEMYALAGLGTLMTSLFIVALHGYKVAQKNPAEVLQSE